MSSAPTYDLFIDESGDCALRSAGSEHFVLAGVLIPSAAIPRATAGLVSLRVALGRGPTDVLHFQNLSKNRRRVQAASGLCALPVSITTAVVIDKASVATESSLSSRRELYFYALQLLLERVSWFVRDSGGGTARVTVAHIARMKVSAYQSAWREYAADPGSMEWGVYAPYPIHVSNPKTQELLQVADLAVSAIARAIGTQCAPAHRDDLLRALWPTVYRRNGHPAPSYGLKVFPGSATHTGGTYAWLPRWRP